MTYDNDERLRSANTPLERRVIAESKSGVSPMVLGAILLALILGGVLLFSGGNTNTASNQTGTTVSAPARVNPPTSTTGSGATSPGPAVTPTAPTTTR